MRIVFALTLATIGTVAATSCSNHFGVDDWDADHVAKFFKSKANVKIPPSTLTQYGITGHKLFDGLMTDATLEALGVADATKRTKALAAIAELDERLTHQPSDVWEWRLANRRLCDFWVITLWGCAPRSLLIWLRFFDHDDETGALERVDDVIDQMGPVNFWLTWLCVPSLPFARLARQLDLSGYMDTMVYLIAQLWVIAGFLVVAIIAFLPAAMKGPYLKQCVISELTGIAYTVLTYYILYPIIPNWLSDACLYFTLVISPIFFLGVFLFSLVMCYINQSAKRMTQITQAPAAPCDFLKELGPRLLTASGECDTAELLSGKTRVLLYFSAHWCTPCRGYTPELNRAYKEACKPDEASPAKTAIVFVSSDKDADAFAVYFGQMSFYALPYDSQTNRNAKVALSKKYGVGGIPALVALDGNGILLDKNARGNHAKYL